MSDSRFPARTKTTIDSDDLVDFLIHLESRGYQVFQANAGKKVYELVLDESKHITYNYGPGGKVQVQGFKFKNIVNFIDCDNMPEVQRATNRLAQTLIGSLWESGPTSIRIQDNRPATNFGSISRLIGNASINAVFDPYLENRSLSTLIEILSFGEGTVANGVRVLCTSKTTKGHIPRLTRDGFQAWLCQLGITGELRIMNDSEHRRFLLLNNEKSIILGPSLNQIHKNEAVRLEPHEQDMTFFNMVWEKASVMK